MNETRGLACELVAWRFVSHLTYRESIDTLCYDLPQVSKPRFGSFALSSGGDDNARSDLEAAGVDATAIGELSPLLDRRDVQLDDPFATDERPHASEYAEQSNFAASFSNLNALEIAAVANAKKFLAQRAIQRIVDGIWHGDISFWHTMAAGSTKQAKIYRKAHSDPYCRLRVPLYLKVFEVLFFAAFLAFYYIVLVQKHSEHITGPEIMMYIWLAAFTYNGEK